MAFERVYWRDSTTPFRTMAVTGPLISGKHSHDREMVYVYAVGATRAQRVRAAVSSLAGAVLPELHAAALRTTTAASEVTHEEARR